MNECEREEGNCDCLQEEIMIRIITAKKNMYNKKIYNKIKKIE